MRGRTLRLWCGPILFGVLTMLLFSGRLLSGASKPLDQEQILGLVKGEVASQRIAEFVRTRGISFAPTPEFLRQLQQAGAKTVLIAALRRAAPKPAARQLPQEPEPTLTPQALLYAQRYKQEQTDFRLGEQDLARQRYAEAETEMRKVVSVEPNDPIACFDLGVALSHEGKWQEAASEYDRVLQIVPDSAKAHYNLAIALEKENKRSQAIAQIRDALQLDPRNERAAYGLGVILSQNGDWPGAVAEFRVAARLAPSSSNAHCALGLALLHQKDLGEAILQLQQALALNPQNVRAHAGLGTALLQNGNLVAAREQFQVAAALRAVIGSR